MSSYNEELKLKLAWQTAFEQRTCPPAEILYTKSPDEQLKKHLSFCDSCRESREIAKDGNIGFQNMFRRITPEVLKPETELNKQPGQIWAVSKSLGRWMDDGRYSSPPAVLLLSNRDDASHWKVAQLYTDRRLMGNGDVWLGDQFGFAQAWNSYTLRQDILGCLLGSVSESVVAEVISVAAAQVKQYEEDSIISFFRELEIAVGANVAVPLVATELAASMQNETFLQNIFGTLADAYKKLSGFKLPEYAESLVDLLSGAIDPHGVSPVIAATSIPLQVNIVIKQMDGAITIKTVGATLTESNWEDEDYYIAGKLKDIQQEDLFLVASLNVNGIVVCECQSSIEKGSPYFDIVFKSVTKEASLLENLKFILVKP